MELAPRGTNDAEIVWEWHSWDHLIQDFDPDAANYGVLSEHPELADINTDAEEISDAEIQALLAGGEIALQDAEESPNAPDLMHFNSITYNPTLDQIIVSANSFSEFWIIDHSTTTQEAVDSTGGRQGMGGDILYTAGVEPAITIAPEIGRGRCSINTMFAGSRTTCLARAISWLF